MNINYIELKEKILYEMKRTHKKANDIWQFSNCLAFYNKLELSEKNNFDKIMQELCEEDIFIKEEHFNGDYNYRLTLKGEDIIYR